ncbi:hypothetical protein ABIB40_002462 [Pedobacter sp. UYP30]|uniref:glycoside hydrolase family 16 protein n=1 Tax=Pedobacter sp. UYP30 TaxID=1756400 RepID=UPI003395D613
MKQLFYVLICLPILASCAKKIVNPKKDKTPISALQYGNLVDTISFSGYTWRVRKPSNAQGPGPNYWSGANVWVDEKGWLHLLIKKNETTNRWECAEVSTLRKLGYGNYQWQVEGALSTLDKNVVLGLFNYSGNDRFDEMDIEIARWGNSSYPNLNYTIYPQTGKTDAKPASYVQEFSISDTKTTHRFIRTATEITLKSLKGFNDDDTGLFASKTFGTADVPVSSLEMPVFINLWLFDGHAPTDGKSVEVVIKGFKFSPN